MTTLSHQGAFIRFSFAHFLPNYHRIKAPNATITRKHRVGGYECLRGDAVGSIEPENELGRRPLTGHGTSLRRSAGPIQRPATDALAGRNKGPQRQAILRPGADAAVFAAQPTHRLSRLLWDVHAYQSAAEVAATQDLEMIECGRGRLCYGGIGHGHGTPQARPAV
jgi:hypothetical protein